MYVSLHIRDLVMVLGSFLCPNLSLLSVFVCYVLNLFFFQSRCFAIPLNDAQVLLKHMRKREIIKSPVPFNDGDVSPPFNKNH